MFDEPILLHANVDIGELLAVAGVEVAQLDPAVHQPQGHLLVFLLVVGDLAVVVAPARLFHHFAVVLPESLHRVEDRLHHET